MYTTESTLENTDVSNEELHERFEAVHRRLEQLERTLSAVAHDATGVRIGGPCTRCERSLLLIRDNSMSCPACQYQRSL